MRTTGLLRGRIGEGRGGEGGEWSGGRRGKEGEDRRGTAERQHRDQETIRRKEKEKDWGRTDTVVTKQADRVSCSGREC